MDVSTLNLSFFGGYQVSLDQHNAVSLRGRKAQALLAYLAVGASQAHRRESLLGLLWPDMPEADARNNLRVVTSRIRRLNRNQNVPFLLSSRYDLQFNGASEYWLDVTAFKSILQETEQHPHENRAGCPICQEKIREATSYYQGEFLAGFYLDGCPTFDEWLFVQREELHLQMMTLLEELAAAHEKQSDFSMAERFARRQIELDPLRETAHLKVMRSLAYQGQRTAALTQYQNCQQLLVSELGVAPTAELTLLAEQIRDDTLVLPAKLLPEMGVVPKQPPPQLPVPTAPFIGREEELDQLAERLIVGSYRLISIIGPGGIGKTRFALQAASENQQLFKDGTYFVPLASVQTVAGIPTAVAFALGLVLGSSPEPPEKQLLNYLRTQNLLLLIDNLEHLMGGVDFLMQILTNAPQVTLLITSRERLNVRAEDLFRLRGLPIPKAHEMDRASQFAAVRLFCDRAYRLQKSFRLTEQNRADVVRICQMVEGLPLGIELASSWIRDFSVTDLANSLAGGLDMLDTDLRDMPAQHRSMRSVFDYSWQLLTPSEKKLLQKLALFAGSFSLGAATAVAQANPALIARLRYKSLLRGAGSGRYDMHTLVQQFATEKWVDDLALKSQTERRFSDYFLDFVVQRTDLLHGQYPLKNLTEIELELDNIRLAWSMAVSNGRWSSILKTVIGLGRYYFLVGNFAEAERIFSETFSLLSSAEDHIVVRQLQLKLHLEIAYSKFRQGNSDQALQYVKEAHILAQHLGDRFAEVRAYLYWGLIFGIKGDWSKELKYFEKGLALAREHHFKELEGEILIFLGFSLFDLGQTKKGETQLQDALTIQHSLGNRYLEQILWLYLGSNRVKAMDYQTGLAYLTKAEQLSQFVGSKLITARIVDSLGFVKAALGDWATAVTHMQKSQKISHEIGDLSQKCHALYHLCAVNRKMGQLTAAEEYGLKALQVASDHNLLPAEYAAWLYLGYVKAAGQQWIAAANAFTQAQAGMQAINYQILAMEASVGLAGVWLKQGYLKKALAEIEPVLLDIIKQSLSGTFEPGEVTLTCYQVLQANGDGRCQRLLQNSYQWLLATAQKITDLKLRASFLENVPAHKKIINFYLSDDHQPHN